MKIKFLVEQIELLSQIFRHIPIPPSPVEAYLRVTLVSGLTESYLEFSRGEYFAKFPLNGFCEEEGACSFSAKEMSTLSNFFVGQKTLDCSFSNSVLTITGDQGTMLRIQAVEVTPAVAYTKGEQVTRLSKEDMDFLAKLKGQHFSSGGCFFSESAIELYDGIHLAQKKASSLNKLSSYMFSVDDILCTLMNASIHAGGCPDVFFAKEKEDIIIFSGSRMEIYIPLKKQEHKNFNAAFDPDFLVDKKILATALNSFSSKNKAYQMDFFLKDDQLHLLYHGKNLDQMLSIPVEKKKEIAMASCNIKLLKELLKTFHGKKIALHWDGRLLYMKDEEGLIFCILAGMAIRKKDPTQTN